MDFREIIRAKRDGARLGPDQLRYLASGAASGAIPDYQLSAWLMAAFLKGLDVQETAELTLAMAASGERLDLSSLPKPWVDKHSTGGVGDKATLVVLPLLAACGLTMVKMSGRGLGITGGTVDKLESVPGFRMDLSPEEMLSQAARIGIAITGQTPRLAPADKALYALRDVTATVDSIPLIVASILSKKIAGGADTISIDVKCGDGAFMHCLERAQALASTLSETASVCGLKLCSLVTDMSQPLGRAAGNALEVREAIDVLQGGGPARLVELCVELAANTLSAVGVNKGRKVASECLSSGRALAKAEEWFEAQGGALNRALPKAPAVRVLEHGGEGGSVARWSAKSVGEAVVELGGGRKVKGDPLDPSVGVVSLIEVGDSLVRGQPIAEIHAKSLDDADRVAEGLRRGLTVSCEPVLRTPVIAFRPA